MVYVRESALRRRACRIGLVTAAALGLAVALGCAGRRPVQPATDRAGEGVPSVVIAAGDELDVRFFYTPELNTSQTVRADGMISLELVGDVQAAGVAPVELQNKLEELYSGHLVEPSVTVFLKTQYARYVLVSGQIKRTGLVQTPVVVRLPAANEVTLEDAIIMAGGYDPATADLSTVLVIRQKEGKRVVSSVDLRPVFGVTEAPAEGYEPFYVQPGDIVHLPETRIVEADRWVDQHINQLVPRVGFFISTVTGTTTIGYSTR